MRPSTFALVAIASLAATTNAAAQTLASRVDNAPDGRVQFTYAAKAGVCGNGRTYIQSGPNNYNGNFYDGMRLDPCIPGPVRVVIDRADRQPLSIQTYVGPDTIAAGTTNLGRVRAQDAADYLLSLAVKVDGRAGRDAIFPAVLADSASTSAGLLSIAKNQTLPRQTRSQALAYMGRSTDGMTAIPATVTEPILVIARDETDNQQVRQQALSVLARLDHGAGIPPLIELSKQTQSNWLARESMTTLSRSGDPRAREYLRTAVKRTDLPDDVLATALRALGQDYATAQDAVLLRSIYPTLKSERTRQSVEEALTEIGGAENTKWLLTQAQDPNETLQNRRRAMEAASRAGAPIAELVKLYDTTTDPQMKQTLIGIYMRNGERVAVDKLINIVQSEGDQSVRRSAINQLSRSEDPRVRQALQDIIVKSR